MAQRGYFGGIRAGFSRQFSSLAEYNFRVFFFGQVVSLIGTWMQSVGLAWLALELTHSSVAIGLVTTVQFLPMMLFALVGGVLADWLPRRKTLIVVQTLAMLQAGALGFLVVADMVALWQVYLLAFAAGLLSAIERPMRQTFFIELVGREKLPNAVGLHSSILNGSRVIGPAVAGFLIATVGVEATFLLNAASYLAVLVGYLRMKPATFHAARARRAEGSMWGQIVEGLRYATTTPSPAFIFLLIGFLGTFGYNFTVVIPLLTRFVLDTGAAKFGLLTSALSLGSLFSAFWLAGGGVRSHRFMVFAAVAFSASFGLLAFSESYYLTVGILFVVGLTSIALMTAANTTLQVEAPEEMRGRVISIYMLLMTGSTPIGGFLTGLLSDRAGVRPAIGIEAGLCGAGVLVALWYRWAHRAVLSPIASAGRSVHPAA
jgi:MFS family permease